MTDTPQVLLSHHLKTLKLPTFLREYDKLARQCAAEGADHVRYLVRLAELELIDRERRMVERRIARFPAVKSLDSFDFKAIASLNKMLVLELVERRIRQARFPAVKSLDSFDFKAIASLNKMLVLELARCEYVERRENVNTSSVVRTSSRSATQAPARPISPSVSVWRPARRGSRWGS